LENRVAPRRVLVYIGLAIAPMLLAIVHKNDDLIKVMNLLHLQALDRNALGRID
jgi:hypothetical protein